jgi:hypothetical protein
MQNAEHAQGAEYNLPDAPQHHRRPFAVVAAAVVVVLVSAAAAYAVGSSHTSTKTIVKTVATPAPTAPTAAPVADRGFSQLDNGHQAIVGQFYQPMSAATRLVLQHQLMLARAVAMKYPTVKDAVAAGYRRQGPFAPGLGAHYSNSAFLVRSFTSVTVMSDAEVLHPAMLIYDGTHPNSQIAGLMYMALGYPQGFAGPNDIWHYHTNVCIVRGSDGTTNTPFGADTTVSTAMCNGVHGALDPRTPWMLHAWVVPGYDSTEGVFSHDNAAMTCDDGTYHTISLASIGNRASVCADGTE